MRDLESLDTAFVIDTFLLLLIGIGPRIALVPFLDMTMDMSRTTRRRVLRKMLVTAATVAVLLLVLGGLLTRVLHFSPGALGVASGILGDREGGRVPAGCARGAAGAQRIVRRRCHPPGWPLRATSSPASPVPPATR